MYFLNAILQKYFMDKYFIVLNVKYIVNVMHGVSLILLIFWRLFTQ